MIAFDWAVKMNIVFFARLLFRNARVNLFLELYSKSGEKISRAFQKRTEYWSNCKLKTGEKNQEPDKTQEFRKKGRKTFWRYMYWTTSPHSI